MKKTVPASRSSQPTGLTPREAEPLSRIRTSAPGKPCAGGKSLSPEARGLSAEEEGLLAGEQQLFHDPSQCAAQSSEPSFPHLCSGVKVIATSSGSYEE